jgi:DNA (cytosine-5)-methyltransferase 1
MLKVGTDFSGIGSPEAALKRLGLPHENIFACDIDKYAKKSYLELNNPKTFYQNITTRDHKEVEQLDLYVAGFPCQAFSLAGKREGFSDKTRGTLFFDVAEFIRINQPNCFILENVKGLISHDGGRTFQTILDVLSNGGGTINGQMGLDSISDGLGYHVYYKVLNSKDYGIPQNRERIFIVGFKDWREFRFPKKQQLKIKLKDILQDNPKGDVITIDEKYYLSDKMKNFVLTTDFREAKPISIDNISPCLKVGGDVPCFIDEDHNAKTIIGAMRGRYKDNSKKTEQRLELNSEDYTNTLTSVQKDNLVVQLNQSKESGGQQPYKQNRIYDGDYISPVLDTECGRPAYKFDCKIRRLTPLETWRLQGFTDQEFWDAQKVNSDTQLYKQAGNSITVNVMVELFKKIYLT